MFTRGKNWSPIPIQGTNRLISMSKPPRGGAPINVSFPRHGLNPWFFGNAAFQYRRASVQPATGSPKPLRIVFSTLQL
jgi:hypothetical protein